MMGPDDQLPAPEPDTTLRRSRTSRVALWASMALAGAVVGAIVAIMTAPVRGDGPPVLACSVQPVGTCPAKGAPFVDGLVKSASAGSFTLELLEGRSRGSGATRTFYVRKPDRVYIDVGHAQSHAALGQPVRVYSKRIGGKDIVIHMQDAPLLRPG